MITVIFVEAAVSVCYRGYYIEWPIMRVPGNDVLTSEEVKEALRPLHAPGCPHLRLSDARVVQNYKSRLSTTSMEIALRRQRSRVSVFRMLCIGAGEGGLRLL